MATNFHMHTIFCDGKNQPEEYVLLALKKKMTGIGFSSHVTISLDNNWSMRAESVGNYSSEIARLKEKYAKQIEIYSGFEMDYLPTDDEKNIHKYIDMVDYTIGSVHYLYDKNNNIYYSVDGSKDEVDLTFNKFFNGNAADFVKFYYCELLRVAHKFRPNIIGHLDIYKKQNKDNTYFNEHDNWYQSLIDQVLDEIVALGLIVEVNTGGMLRGFVNEPYPSFWILQECYKRKIPIIVSSDAHRSEDIDGFFSETIKQLRTIGFSQQRILRAGKWIDVEL